MSSSGPLKVLEPTRLLLPVDYGLQGNHHQIIIVCSQFIRAKSRTLGLRVQPTRSRFSTMRCFTMKFTSFSLARLWAAWLRSGSSLFSFLFLSCCSPTLSSPSWLSTSISSLLVTVGLTDTPCGNVFMTGWPRAVGVKPERQISGPSWSGILINA